MPWKHCLLLLLSLLVYAQPHPTVALQSANATINQATEGCANQKASQLRVLALFDIGQEDEVFFRRQQSRLEETLRHIDTVAGKKGRPPLYGLIAFLRPAVVLSGLNSPQAKSLDRVIKQIHALKHRHRANSSAPTKALEVAAELLLSDGNRGGLVLLVHQGKKNEGDSIADAIAASQRLTANGVFLFSIVGEYSEGDALISDRAKVLAEPADKERFLEAIQREIHLCTGLDDNETDNKIDGKRKVPEVEPVEQVEKGEHQQSNVEDQLDFGCKNQAPRKMDLLLALDTSGSVFSTFGRQRQLAVDLISALNPTPQLQQLRFGLISFAAQPAVVLPLVEGSDRQLVLDRLRTIEFTGGSTRIAEAAELALAELAKFGRAEALKVLVLISDGHGEEPWKRAQEVGRRLQRTPQLQLFAVSASADFNRAELGLYMGGAERRMFLGQRHLSFVPTLAGLLNNCMSSNGTLPEDPENEDKEIGEKSVAEELVIRQLLSNSSAHSSLGNKEVATNESVANIGRKKGTERRLKDQPMEEGSEENEEPNGSIRRDQSVAEESGKEAEEKKEEKAKGGGKRRTSAEQQSLSGDCPTDLLFLLDRFSPGGDIFERQLGLAMQLVERLQAADVDQGKARLAAVSFGREPRLEASWEERLAKADFQHRLRAVQPARVQSSFAQAVNLTLQQIRLHRRPSARLLLFVLWSGSNGRNTAEELSRAVRPFGALARTELFAVTVNPAAQLDRLRVLAGDQWHVFLDARAKQFVDQAARILLDCVLPPSGDLLRQGNLPDEEGPTASTGLFSHEPQDSVERVEHLQVAARALQRQHAQNCQNDPIDLFILLHSASNGRHFSAQKRAVMDVLRQAPAEHFDRRIRLFLWVGTRPIHLTKADPNDGGDAKVSSLDDALFAVDRMDWPLADETKPALGLADTLAEALAEWTAKGRRVEARPALVLLTDGAEAGAKQKNEADQPTEMEMLKQALEGHAASAFALNFGPEAAEQGIRDLLAGTGNSSDPVSARQASLVRVFSAFAPGKMARFVDEFRRRVIWCRDGRLGQADSAMPAEKIHRPPKLAGLFVSEGGGTAEEEEEAEEKKRKKGKDSNKKEEAKQQQSNNNTASTNTESVSASLPTTIRPPQTQAPPIAEQQATVSNNISNEEEGPRSRRVSLLNSECKVDLMLIIDTSQSVAEEFQQQLQFAVDLVKRLPDQDFGQRVQVGVVSFHRAGRRQFALGELREKQAVLDALLGIQHTGGSTSVVNGINLAIEEVEKRRRKDARLMMVLVSDGNSQDPWADVVATADRLRAVQADVYAVTVSHDYFFRELELYAGNKWFVYIDARIRQFLDEAEMSLVECRSPSVPTATTGTIIGGIDSGNGIGTSLLPAIATSPSTPANILLTVTNNTTPKPDEKERVGSGASKDCRNDPVDLLFIVDTSTSVERDFYAQKIFALDLVRVLPEQDFARRLSIGLVKFHAEALLQFPFRVGRRRDDVLYEIERIEHTGGQTSLVAGVELALAEIDKSHRPGARLVVVIISDGNSQDEWSRVQKTAQKLRNATRGELFAVTLSKKYAADELLEYTKDEGRIFTDEGVERFLQEVGRSVVGCPEQLPTDGGRPPLLLITPVPSEEAQPTPAPRSLRLLLKTNSTADAQSDQQNLTEKKKSTAPSTGARGRLRGEFARDPGPVQLAKETNSAAELLEDGSKKTTKEAEEEEGQGKCRFAEMDLIIILDASTSRESVFEQQRELALSLIERLPISRGGTHVAMGINSFTNVPVLRQTLGLGRDRKMVRKAIEDIKYRGGSTLTSKAVELAVQDLERGRRKDALQVVVLMNDGMSQDPWDRVLDASKKLAQTGAQRFGVALGEEVDLRELKHYVGDEQRIYRDGSTERFLQDMVALLGANDPECQQQRRKSTEELKLADEGAGGFDFQMDENSSGGCQGPKLDLVVLLDNTDTSDDDSDPKLNSNRYLLLDVLGSLPLGHRVKVAVLSIGGPRLEYTFADPQAPEALFRRIEQIRPVRGKPRYAQAIESGLDYFSASRRPDAKGLMLLVGDGRNAIDSREERNRASGLLKRAQNTLSCHSVASSKQVDEQTLTAFTGSPSRIYAYDRNAEFAHFLLDQASAQTCQQQQQQQQPVAGIAREQQSPNSTENRRLNTKPSVADQLDDANHSQFSKRGQRQRDIARAGETGDINSKLFGGAADGGKLLARGGEKRVGPTVQQVLERLRARERLETSSKEREEKESEEEKEAKKKKADELEAARKARAEERIRRLKAEERKKLEQALALAQQNRPQIQLNGVTARPGRKDQQQQRTASGDQQNGARAEVNNSRIQQLQQQTTASSSSRGQGLANTTKSSRSRDTTAFPFSSSTSSAPPATAAKTSAALSFNTQQQQQVQQEEEAEEEPFRPGCLLDVLLLIDCSGSVGRAFEREKQLAAEIVQRLRLGPRNARVALIKFAAAGKVRTIRPFGAQQSRQRLLHDLEALEFSDGVTAIHSALQQAIVEYSPLRGARPGLAQPLALVFTDGFGQQNSEEEARLLRRLVPNVYAIGVTNNGGRGESEAAAAGRMAVAREELARISGDPSRVFTDQNVAELHRQLQREHLRGC